MFPVLVVVAASDADSGNDPSAEISFDESLRKQILQELTKVQASHVKGCRSHLRKMLQMDAASQHLLATSGQEVLD